MATLTRSPPFTFWRAAFLCTTRKAVSAAVARTNNASSIRDTKCNRKEPIAAKRQTEAPIVCAFSVPLLPGKPKTLKQMRFSDVTSNQIRVCWVFL